MTIRIPHNFDPATRPYQLQILKNPSRFKSLIIHRKAGKTALALNKLIIESQLNPGKVFWYVAPTYRQAKEIVWKDPEMLQRYLPEAIVSKKNDTELSVYFKNGSVLSVKGADEPDSLRGPNPMGTILDEFPTMKPAVWEEIISPIVFANPQAWTWFVGTPKPGGVHAKRIHDEARSKPGWYAMTLTAEDSNLISPEVLEDAKRTMTQAAFEQEFLCKWFNEGGVVFRGVDSCVDGEYRENPDARFSYQFGFDLAMHVDWTVGIGINKNTHRVEFFDRYNQIDYNLQKARIEASLRRYNNPTCNMDQTGVGEPIVQDLQSRGLNINGVKFTEESKRNLVTNLALMIEQRKIRFPNIPELIEELKIFGYEISPSGRVRYSAPEGSHDDCVMALALAVWNLGSKLSAELRFQGPRPKVKFAFN